MQACRDQLLRRPQTGHESHAGLLLARYLSVSVGDSKLPERKRELFETARRANGNSLDLYRAAFHRRGEWVQALRSLGGEALAVQGDPRGPLVADFTLFTPPNQRLVIGLGSDSPLEAGLTLNRTYGTPMLPGSALKGLTAHYCDQVVGGRDPQFMRDHREVVVNALGKEESIPIPHEVLFGTGDSAGFITFHDAWISSESLSKRDEGLLEDVMTPHHGDYCGGKEYTGGSLKGQLIPPTDFDSPVPVQFLSLRGAFHFVLTCDDTSTNGRKWLEFTRDLLITALEDWGIGGKTSSGYGRLVTEGRRSDSSGGDSAGRQKTKPVSSPPSPKHKRGDRLKVKRIEAPKGKVKFQADDSFFGHIGSGPTPSCQVGEFVELWVANVSPQGYTFVMEEPRSKKK
jgi:CRISPR type III-B/RAMP module RAMP protein Cmr6